MRKATPLLAVLAVAGVSVGELAGDQAQTPQEIVAECDRLAASPFDPERRAEGVESKDLDGAAIIAACSQAVRLNTTPRLQYQYARGLGHNERNEEAAQWYLKAADQGHAVAQNNLASLYWNGQGVPQDYTTRAGT